MSRYLLALAVDMPANSDEAEVEGLLELFRYEADRYSIDVCAAEFRMLDGRRR